MKAILCAALMAVIATPLFAQQTPCGPRAEMVEMATGQYGEVPIGSGLTSRGLILEVYVHPETGNFTVMITLPDGQACVPAHGTGWEAGGAAPAGGKPA